MFTNAAPAFRIRARVLASGLHEAISKRRFRAGGRALASFVSPGRWPPATRHRAAVLDARVEAGDPFAARLALTDLANDPAASRPGHPAAMRRAAAMALLAEPLPVADRRIEMTVVSYIRGELGSTLPRSDGDAESVSRVAVDFADALRGAGFDPPILVATFPGFIANPYARLMERAYRANGLAAVHVDDVESVNAIIAAQARGRYRVVVHSNAPDRFVSHARTEAEAVAVADRALREVDAWIAAGARIIATIHNGPRHTEYRGVAERIVAQGIIGRADLVQILTAGTPELLDGWVDLGRARVIHVPHPNYDSAYAPYPSRDEARRQLGFRPGPPAAGGDVVVGMLGSLVDRKGCLLLLDALNGVPDPLPSGRRVRVLIGGILGGADSEALIRRAMADERVTARFGFIPDAELVRLLVAMDVAVIPYRNYLNSGWLHLALSAGIPIIAPVEGTAREIVAPDALLTFSSLDEQSLARAMTDAERLTYDDARRAARDSVADLDADRLSEQFVQAVLAAIDGGVGSRR